MNIHNVSGVNNPNIHLSEIDRPAHNEDFAKSGNFVKGDGESTQWGLPKE
jgi:vacuolar-type H+-ATPase subunit D/Vma8